MPCLRFFLLLAHANHVAQFVLCRQARVRFLSLQLGRLRLLLVLVDAQLLGLGYNVALTLLVDFDLLRLTLHQEVLVFGQFFFLLLDCLAEFNGF